MLSNSVVTKVTCVPDLQIRSDMDGTMYYTLLGHGASEEPYNLFVVEETTGQVRIFNVLDREERASYIVSAIRLCESIMYDHYMT